MLLTTSGTLYALGSNEFGQLGLGSAVKSAVSFTRVAAMPSPVQDVACGHEYTIACTQRGGALYSWGHPEYGQLGHGTTYVTHMSMSACHMPCVPCVPCVPCDMEAHSPTPPLSHKSRAAARTSEMVARALPSSTTSCICRAK